VFSNSSYESTAKWETCQILKEDVVGAYLVVASVNKTTTLLGVSRAAVSKIITAYINHGKTSAERDCQTLKRVVFKNHSNAAEVTAELNIHLEDPVSTKRV